MTRHESQPVEPAEIQTVTEAQERIRRAGALGIGGLTIEQHGEWPAGLVETRDSGELPEYKEL